MLRSRKILLRIDQNNTNSKANLQDNNNNIIVVIVIPTTMTQVNYYYIIINLFLAEDNKLC